VYSDENDPPGQVVYSDERVSRFKPDFCSTILPWFSWLPLPDFDIFLMDKSSTNTTAWFLLRSFDNLSAKSFLMMAIWLYDFETLTLAFFQ